VRLLLAALLDLDAGIPAGLEEGVQRRVGVKTRNGLGLFDDSAQGSGFPAKPRAKKLNQGQAIWRGISMGSPVRQG
jgi:hypothetical protein